MWFLQPVPPVRPGTNYVVLKTTNISLHMGPASTNGPPIPRSPEMEELLRSLYRCEVVQDYFGMDEIKDENIS